MRCDVCGQPKGYLSGQCLADIGDGRCCEAARCYRLGYERLRGELDALRELLERRDQDIARLRETYVCATCHGLGSVPCVHTLRDPDFYVVSCALCGHRPGHPMDTIPCPTCAPTPGPAPRGDERCPKP